MGKNDWKNKPLEECTGEDVLWSTLENCGTISGFLKFRFQNYIYWIWETPKINVESEDGKFADEKEYDNYEDLMEDKNWNGLSMSEILRKIPWDAFEET